MKIKFYAFLLLLTLGGGAHAVTLSDTARAAVLSKKIIAAYTAEDYATTTKLFMEYDQLDAALPLPLMLVRVRAYYHLGEFFAAYQLLGDYLNLASPDSPDYDTALDMYIALEAKPGMTEAIAKAEAKAEAEVKAKFAREVGHQPSPTGRDADGRTDLHHAARKNLREVAALLLEKGAAVNAKDNNGETPLHDAAIYNAVATATLLLERGAAVNAKDNNGITPLGYTTISDADEAAALLRRHGGKMQVALHPPQIRPYTDSLTGVPSGLHFDVGATKGVAGAPMDANTVGTCTVTYRVRARYNNPDSKSARALVTTARRTQPG